MDSSHEADDVCEAAEILKRVEGNARSFRWMFLLSLAGLSALVVASAKLGVEDVIQTKELSVIGENNAVLGVVALNSHKVVVGTTNGPVSLVSAGEGVTGGGVIALSAPNGKDVIRLSNVKNGGGSVSVNGPDGTELANISPNITNAGSVFIDNAAGTLVGEINGDKQNGGAIILHDAQGKEIGRVHQ